jgi:polyhydroxyalkanoic acid synthase PhaR subunit
MTHKKRIDLHEIADGAFTACRKELLQVSDERGGRAVTDPTELWRQWYETGTKMWSDAFAAGRENYMDPYGVYRQWFNGLEDLQERMFGSVSGPSGDGSNAAPVVSQTGASMNPAAAQKPATDAVAGQVAEAQNLWKQWFDAVSESWQKASTLGTEAVDLAPRWVATLDQIRNNFLSAQGYPSDPLQFVVRWYNATSGPLSDFVGDLIERENILDTSSHFLQSYASFYKVFRRDSEEYLKSLSFPVRSDITRVASLVVALEDKIDRLEEAFEDGYAKPTTAEAVGGIEDRVKGLEKRLEGVESKIDKLLTALENAPQNGDAQDEAVQEDSQADGEVRATAAARRKARELGVELSEVEGTGLNDQITVDDVRRQNAREEGES